MGRARVHVVELAPDHLFDERRGGGFGDQAFADGFAVAQHGVAVGDLVDLVEEVADVDHREPLGAEFANDAEQRLLVFVRERAGRLVHDDDLGLAEDGARDFDDLLAGDGQGLRLLVWRDVIAPEQFERRRGLR